MSFEGLGTKIGESLYGQCLDCLRYKTFSVNLTLIGTSANYRGLGTGEYEVVLTCKVRRNFIDPIEYHNWRRGNNEKLEDWENSNLVVPQFATAILEKT